jgi:D-ribulokinase
MSDAVYVGIDAGTSGMRAIAIDGTKEIVAQSSSAMADHGTNYRDPAVWKAAMVSAMQQLLAGLNGRRIAAISVDGTSGTVLPIDASGRPVAEPLMYNDPVGEKTILDSIAAHAPETSAALGSNSALARAIVLQNAAGTARIVHQADWLAGLISGRFDRSDANNALKTGYDPVMGAWPDWIDATGIAQKLLPAVTEPGTVIGEAEGELARLFKLATGALIVAGTTDGCASFLATGANQPGDAVTALGTTLTVKLLSDEPVFAPRYGIYSHRIAGAWLAGGASNTGGNVLAAHFDNATIERLSNAIDPETDTGLDYYPLLKPGERFPVNDPAFPPRMTPRPTDDATFLKAILEGIANAETLGYRRLEELGAPKLKSMRTVGGGARNAAWTAMRCRKLGVPFEPVKSREAAYGTALLALSGVQALHNVPRKQA